MAKKEKLIFYCQNCGYESAKWMGQCPACNEWNSFVEETVSAKSKTSALGKIGEKRKEPVPVNSVHIEEEDRMRTGTGELDRVLGGGIVKGSLVLVGGDPGIGKSTLLLQVCRQLALQGRKVLYVSGEESLRQIKLRAERIGDFNDQLLLLCETDLSEIKSAVDRVKPELMVIDSIQTMYSEDVSSAPGSVSQVRESTGVLLRIAKGMGISVFIVGHVTKDGSVAGPRVLEHMVDTVLYFEGDRHASYRILRGVKNRFGSTNEIGVFEMQSEGLTEVKNPSEFMLNGRSEGASGSIVTCSMEGTRPVLIEVQALVCRTNFGLPRRTAAGTDYNRVNLLIAVLEKRAGMDLSQSDVYINLAGGIRVTEPSTDLAMLLAIASSHRDIVIPEKFVAFGEVGLGGEIRAVHMAQQRVQEAIKLGFETIMLPAVCASALKGEDRIQLIYVEKINDALDVIMGKWHF